MVEISCHGGPSVVMSIHNLLLNNGFRQAERGEFTFRAFINGKADLTKAEESFYTGQKLKVCNLDTTYQNSVIEKKKLEIIAPANKHVLVFLGFNSRNMERHSVYLIKKGESYPVYLPNGTYKVYFAIGRKWYGIDELFGKNTNYYSYNEQIVTANIDGTYLIDISSDNDQIVKISKGDFPSY